MLYHRQSMKGPSVGPVHWLCQIFQPNTSVKTTTKAALYIMYKSSITIMINMLSRYSLEITIVLKIVSFVQYLSYGNNNCYYCNIGVCMVSIYVVAIQVFHNSVILIG